MLLLQDLFIRVIAVDLQRGYYIEDANYNNIFLINWEDDGTRIIDDTNTRDSNLPPIAISGSTADINLISASYESYGYMTRTNNAVVNKDNSITTNNFGFYGPYGHNLTNLKIKLIQPSNYNFLRIRVYHKANIITTWAGSHIRDYSMYDVYNSSNEQADSINNLILDKLVYQNEIDMNLCGLFDVTNSDPNFYKSPTGTLIVVNGIRIIVL